MRKEKLSKTGFWEVVPAACISLLLLCGSIVLDCVYNENRSIYLHNGLIPLLMWLVLLTCFCSFAIAICYRLLDRFVDRPVLDIDNHNSITLPFGKIIKKYFLFDLAALLVCWMPYMIIRFPGGMDSDTLWQVLETYGYAAKSDHHPWLDTLIFGAFWRLGDIANTHAISLFSYALVQMATTGAALSLCFSYMRYAGCPKITVRFFLCFVALMPIFPVFAQTMCKDSLFGPAYLLFYVCYIEIGRSNGQILSSRKFVVAFILILLLTMMTKKTGIYLVTLSMLFQFVYLSHHKARLLAVVLSSVTLFSVVWSACLLPAMGVAKGKSSEMLSLPAQQTAYYIRTHSELMTENEWKILEEVYANPRNLGSVYNPSRADATKSLFVDDSSANAKLRYAEWYIKTMAQHPANFLLSAMALTLPLYYPDTTTESAQSLLYYKDHLTAFPETGNSNLEQDAVGITGATPRQVHEAIAGATRSDLFAQLSKNYDTIYLQIANSIPFFFSKVLYAFWIPFVLFFYCLKKKRYRNLILLVPCCITLFTLIAGPIPLPRYFVSVMYSVPMLFVCILPLHSKTEGLSGHRGRVK